MRSLGLRVEPGAVHWAVVEGSKANPVVLGEDSVAAPKTFTEAAALAWYRTRVLSVLQENKITSVGVRFAETGQRPSHRNAERKRARIEGVLMEASSSCGIEPLSGPLRTLTAAIDANSAADYLEAAEFRGICWEKRSKPRREAILVAVAALGHA